MNTYLSKILTSLLLILAIGCASVPEGVQPVTPFNKAKYLGKWYEIARFDSRFERDLINTTAEYALREDGSISVTNRGFNTVDEEWESVTGKAKFVGNEDVAQLKVSFFGPFYSGYNVIALDADYQYALVCGGDLDYLWILSRTKNIPENIKTEYLSIADSLGFKTENLIWVKQD